MTPWAQLLARHREAWAARLLEPWSIVDLAVADDPVGAVEAAPDRPAFLWLDGYIEAGERDRLRAAIEQAVRSDVPVVVGFAADSDGVAPREAAALAATLGGATMVTQELAAGSLIAVPDGDDPAIARRRSVHVLVCANLDGALTVPDARLATEVEPLMSGYVAWLEQANRELRAANARLGRERLGVHDAAAAAVEDRRRSLEQRVAELEAALEDERRAAQRSRDALQAPRYRAVDAIRDLAFALPGVSLLLRRRSRRLQRLWRDD